MSSIGVMVWRREFWEEYKKDPKEFETYSNENVEKGFA